MLKQQVHRLTADVEAHRQETNVLRQENMAYRAQLGQNGQHSPDAYRHDPYARSQQPRGAEVLPPIRHLSAVQAPPEAMSGVQYHQTEAPRMNGHAYHQSAGGYR